MSEGRFHVVILAGGSGTRFWPLSRERMPKQLLSILGDRSMLALTLDRARSLVPEERIWAVTIRSQAGEVRGELQSLGLPGVKVLEEPAGRNTAAAIGLAAVYILHEDPEAVMAVMPADHAIEQPDRFLALLRAAQEAAREGWLVTLGIRPTRPETGYGYICRGECIDRSDIGSPGVDAFRVARFTEKPGRETAEEYVRSEDFFWNSGVFVWRADRFMDEMREHLPDHYQGLREIHSLGGDAWRSERLAEIYGGFQAISVDYGILERSGRVAVIPAEVGWSDVGSWAALREILEKDTLGNVLRGDVMAVDSRDCLVYAEERLVAILGVQALVVVDTPDALLVCREDQSQNVKRIADNLREQGRGEALAHRAVLKPWGAVRFIHGAEGYQVRRLEVLPGKQLVLESHQDRAGHWIVVEGTATIAVDDRVVELGCGGHLHLPRGRHHRVKNRGEGRLRMIEVQTGEHLGEDDLVRDEDDDGRIPG